MKQLDNTIKRLKTDSLNAVTVRDELTDSLLVCNKTAEALEAEHGSIEAFFTKLSKRFPSIRISNRRQNGTHGGKVNYKPVGESYIVDFEKETETVFSRQGDGGKETERNDNPPQPVYPTTPILFPPYMHGAGLGNPAGLHSPETAIYRTMDYDRLNRELDDLKKKHEELRKKHSKTKKKLLAYEFNDGKSIENKRQGSELVQNLIKAAPALAGAFMKPQSAEVAEEVVSGLAGAVSPTHQNVMEIVNFELDEAQAYYVGLVARAMPKSEAVTNGVIELVEKYNLEKQD